MFAQKMAFFDLAQKSGSRVRAHCGFNPCRRTALRPSIARIIGGSVPLGKFGIYLDRAVAAPSAR